jgi:Ca2+-binding RTX toxin-like protein
MSADGRYVAYTTQSTNLHPEKTTSSNGVVRKDLLTGEIILVSPPSAVNARFPSISASGRFILFGADNDFGLGDNNKTQSVFLYDAQTAKTELVTSSNFMGLEGSGNADQPPYAVSADGRYVAFATWLSVGTNSYRYRIYVKDMLTGASTIVAEEIDIPLFFASLSADGTHVAISRSNGARITPGVVGYSVFNLKTGARYDIPTRTTNDTQGWQASLSGDGRYLAYVQNWEVFLFDTITGSNQNISLRSYQPGDPLSTAHISPSITLDGRTVATYAIYRINDVVYRGITTYDVVTGLSKRYETTFGTGASINTMFTSSISANGAKFAIHSDVGDLVPDDTNGVRDVFIVDLHRPITAIAPANSSTPESTAVGTTIASLSTSDMFSNTILASYALVAGEGSSSNAFFEIVGNSLVLKRALDYETQTSHSIRIRATDPQGRSYEQVLTVNVTDVTETELVIPGSANNDAFSVTQNSANSWTIRRGSTVLHNGPIPTATDVVIQAGLGTDTLTVNGFNNADTFVIDENSLSLNGIVIRHNSIESRTANGFGQTDTFLINSSIQTVNGGDGQDRFVFANNELNVSLLDGGTSYDTIDYSNKTTPIALTIGSTAAPNITRFIGVESLVGSSADDELRGPNASTNWAITGLNATQVNSVDYLSFENLIGNAANDLFQLWNTNSRITGKINGGALGNDRLTAYDHPNTWSLTDAKIGSIENKVAAFEEIEALVGGAADDTFLVGNLARFTSIDAGNGADRIDFSNFNATVTLTLSTLTASAIGRFSSVERFIGSSRSDAISAPNSANTWNIDGNASGTVNGLAFESFEVLRGGTGADQFNFGPAGAITQIVAGTGIDTLIGPNSNNAWLINGVSRGRLNNTSNFQDVEHVRGGALDDTFEITSSGRITGSLSGGLGTNTLSYKTWTTSVAINTTQGTATGITSLLADFQILVGGNANDNIRSFSGVPSVLVGNNGNDALTGSAARDLLIGGNGSDTLRGGSGEDILIAGATTHDAAYVALANLRAEWNSDRPYLDRIANLQGTSTIGTPLNNGSYLQNSPVDTLLDDNVLDNLYGEDDLDWFIANLATDQLFDRIADEILTNPTQS